MPGTMTEVSIVPTEYKNSPLHVESVSKSMTQSADEW